MRGSLVHAALAEDAFSPPDGGSAGYCPRAAGAGGYDLTAERALLDVPAVPDAIVGFHASRRRKALKAVLAAAGRDFPFTHNITTLMQLCDDAALALPAPLATLDLLTPYPVAGRYGTRSPAR